MKHVELRANKAAFAGTSNSLFFLKKSAYKTHQILVECYGEHALSKATCENWFKRFKSGDFDVQDKPRTGGPKKFEDEELEQLLDEDP